MHILYQPVENNLRRVFVFTLPSRSRNPGIILKSGIDAGELFPL